MPAIVRRECLVIPGRLLVILLAFTGNTSAQDEMVNKYEQQRYDGWYNNLAHPAWGAVDAHLVRKTPPSYADGVYMMSGGNRPSPRNLSQAFMRGADGLGSLKNRTALQTFFGQVGSILNIIAHKQSNQCWGGVGGVLVAIFQDLGGNRPFNVLIVIA